MTTNPGCFNAEVVENNLEGGENRRLRLAVDDGWPGSEPGQFLMLSCSALSVACSDDPLLPRPMAIYQTSSDPRGTLIDILYRVVGRGTALLAARSGGERIRVVGPLGRPFPIPSAGDRAILVGGGTGIASLFSLAVHSAAVAKVSALLGARTASEMMGWHDFAELPVTLGVATDDGSAGHQGLVTELLETCLQGDPNVTIYACGPTPMMRRVAELARACAAPCYVSLENRMACGYGVCLGCAVPVGEGRFCLVCSDGPIFQATEIVWKGLA